MTLCNPLRRVCNRTAYLPAEYSDLVLGLVPQEEHTAADVQQDLHCTMEEHTTRQHYGLALELTGPDAAAVWISWNDADMIFSTQLSHDCLATSPDESAICTEFTGHPGGHTWELTDDLVSGTPSRELRLAPRP